MRLNATSLLALALGAATVALAQPAEGNRINRANIVITQPGTYVLDRDITSFGDTIAIDVNAWNVDIDLMGHSIIGPGGKNGTGIRIRNAQGVRVHNGTVQNFAFGVMVAMSANVTLRDLSISGEGLVPLTSPPETAIMIVQSRAVVVADNNIFNTGLGIFVRGGRSWGNRISRNTITAGTNGVLGICYNPAPDDARGPRGDVISENHITNFDKGIQMSGLSVSNIIRDNTIAFRLQGVDDVGGANKMEGNTDFKLP